MTDLTNREILSFEYIRRELLQKHLNRTTTKEELQELHRLDKLLAGIDIAGVFYNQLATVNEINRSVANRNHDLTFIILEMADALLEIENTVDVARSPEHPLNKHADLISELRGK